MTQTPAQANPATSINRALGIQPVAFAVLGAAVVNVAIYLAFRVAGAEYENTLQPAPVGVPNVLFLTITPMLIGMSAAAFLSRRWTGLLTAARWAGPALPSSPSP